MVKWVKRSTLRWFGRIERMGNEEFVKKVYSSSVEGTNRRGKPLGRWEDKVKKYVSERGARNETEGKGMTVKEGERGREERLLRRSEGVSRWDGLSNECVTRDVA